jgi:hypothetical protein
MVVHTYARMYVHTYTRAGGENLWQVMFLQTLLRPNESSYNAYASCSPSRFRYFSRTVLPPILAFYERCHAVKVAQPHRYGNITYFIKSIPKEFFCSMGLLTRLLPCLLPCMLQTRLFTRSRWLCLLAIMLSTTTRLYFRTSFWLVMRSTHVSHVS